MTATPAQRRYNRWILLLSIAYAALLFIASGLFARHAVAGVTADLVAVLPALPICGCFVLFGHYLADERDEYVRMLNVRQQLIATGLTLVGATIWGFLESFDLAMHLVAWVWPAVWFAGLGLGAAVNKLIERRAA